MPQAKTKFVCKCKSNYGAKGEVIALELDPSKLTKRQAVMLAPYKEPVVKDKEPKKDSGNKS